MRHCSAEFSSPPPYLGSALTNIGRVMLAGVSSIPLCCCWCHMSATVPAAASLWLTVLWLPRQIPQQWTRLLGHGDSHAPDPQFLQISPPLRANLNVPSGLFSLLPLPPLSLPFPAPLLLLFLSLPAPVPPHFLPGRFHAPACGGGSQLSDIAAAGRFNSLYA